MTGEKIAHSATISATLHQAVSDALGDSHALPSDPPAAGMRAEHRAALTHLLGQTRQTLHGVSDACGVGIRAITESDTEDGKSGQSVQTTPQPEYGQPA